MKTLPSCPGLYDDAKPLLTLRDVTKLFGVTKGAVLKWQTAGRLVPTARTRWGGPLFSSEELLTTLREAVSLGLVPVLGSRKKRCASLAERQRAKAAPASPSHVLCG